MGIFSKLERRTPPPSDDYWYRPFSMPSSSGVDVDEQTALGLPAVWLAVNILASTMGSLPLKLYRRTGAHTKEPARDHPLFRIVHRQPNPWHTAFEYRSMCMGHLQLRGNSYSQIVRNDRGTVLGLVPLNPDRMTPRVEDSELIYGFRQADGTPRDFTVSEILHHRGLSHNGIIGLSPITVMRETLGIALAADRHAAVTFKNNARPAGILKVPEKLSPEQKEVWRREWTKAHSGENASSIAILEGGVEYTAIGFSAVDTQFIEQRQFGVVDVARMFNLPPHKLKELSRATFSNIEHQSLEFVIDTIRPHAESQEQRYNVSLLTEREQEEFFFKFSLDALLHGDTVGRAAFYNALFQMGVMSSNDIREKEDMNPVEGGDQRFVPLNLVPLEQAGELDDGGSTRLLPAAPEVRGAELEERSLRLRRRYHKRFKKVFREFGERIVRSEVTELRRAIKAELGERGLSGLNARISKFYKRHETYVVDQMLPLLASFSELIRSAAVSEVGGDEDEDQDSVMERLVHDYAAVFAKRHISSSTGQLEQIIREADAEGVGAALEQRLDEWEEKRPEKIGSAESVRAGAAFAAAAFAALGVAALVWRTIGDTCPLCLQMSKRRRSIDDSFLEKGDTVDPDDGETSPLTVRQTVKHPPLHQGCDCMIVAGR